MTFLWFFGAFFFCGWSVSSHGNNVRLLEKREISLRASLLFLPFSVGLALAGAWCFTQGMEAVAR